MTLSGMVEPPRLYSRRARRGARKRRRERPAAPGHGAQGLAVVFPPLVPEVFVPLVPGVPGLPAVARAAVPGPAVHGAVAIGRVGGVIRDAVRTVPRGVGVT